jgi:SAM-dependent methyltransferase
MTMTHTPPLPVPKAEYLRRGIWDVKGWLNRSTAAYMSSIEVLQREQGIDGDVCEIGVYHGKSFLCLALGLPRHQRAVAIDVFEDQSLNLDRSGQGDREVLQLHLLQLGAGDNVDIVKTSSLELANNGFIDAGRRFRMFSIDGGHTVDITANDLRVAERTVIDDGVVILDDFLNPHWLGVMTGLFEYWQHGGTLTPAAVIPGKLVLAPSDNGAERYRRLMVESFGVGNTKRDVPFGSWTVDVYGEFPLVIRDDQGGEGLLAGASAVVPKSASITRTVPKDYLERLEAQAATASRLSTVSDSSTRASARMPAAKPASPAASARRFAGIRNRVAGAARQLPAPRDEAALEVLRGLKTLTTGRRTTATTPEPNSGGRVGPPLPRVEPIDVKSWVTAPEVTRMGKVVRQVYADTSFVRFDVALLDQLNQEYEDKRIVPKPRSYTSEALRSDAPRRLTWAHSLVDLRDKTVLEIGCGHGHEVWGLAHNLGCDAYGVDVRELGTWAELHGESVTFLCTDLATANPFPADKFDRVISFTVWEHVARPYELLEQTYKVLKPGGLAFLHVNLFAGPQASHRYRDIFFPWPHLLFSDDIIRDWYASHGREPMGAAWVNRLTWDHYERYFDEIGFGVRYLKFWEADWDEGFYRRFEDVLGRYPKDDLKRDYFAVVLEKPAP